MSALFDQIVDWISAALWNLNPAEAVFLGKHSYDGRVPDLSAPVVESQLDRLEMLRERLGGLEGLSADQELDRLHLGTAVDSALFEWRRVGWWRRNPMRYIDPLDTTLYVTRSYAPAGVRAEIAADLLEEAPTVLDAARANLDRIVPATYCEWAVRQARGMADALLHELPGSFGPDGSPRLGDAATAAASALQAYASWIETELLPSADDGFAIGGEAMEELLRSAELVSMPLDRLLALGEADLEANQEAFREAAAILEPGGDPADVYARHVASVRPEPDRLIETTESLLEEIRAFVVGRGLVSVPSEVRALVAATPRHLRWAFAMMNTPGPYETEATEAYYYVTPPEADWDEEQAAEWLAALNTFALQDISIHEAYPGHYVHFLHFDRAPTEVSRRVTSYAFVEGWAHYAEQMMWEEGYADGDLRFRLAQLGEALVRNCRFVCAIRMHAHGMTVDEATRFFVEHAFYPETPARAEAERGTFDPGYFSYTLGKLQILRLREDYRAHRGARFSLREFHEGLLSRGAPPVELMRRVLLG